MHDICTGRRRRALALAFCIAPVLTGCAGLPQHGPPASARPGGAGAAVGSQAGILDSVTGCRLHYTLALPAGPRRAGLVVLAPGFLRSQARMRGYAGALVAAGISTATIGFCNGRFWRGRHFQNGMDMLSLARHLGARRVVYAGFSAGALSALIAAREDPHAVGVIALDLVDDAGLGALMVRGLDKPLIGLIGEPSACNAHNNALAVYRSSHCARLVRVPGSDHCDFEDPTNWVCELFCAGPDASAGIRRSIVAGLVSAAKRLLSPAAPAGCGSLGPVSL